MKRDNKIIVICGPTATGKSALAVELALRFNGEIISADSRQVYKGLDIGSAKITREEMQGIPHHLIDVADPRDTFTVAEFQEQGRTAIKDIQSRGKLPIIVGGTGFYISSLIDETKFPNVPPNPELRAELEKLSAEELVARLEEQDSERANSIDKNNRVRLIRAIEIVSSLSVVPPPPNPLLEKEGEPNLLMIGLTLPKDELVARIASRIETRTPSLFSEISSLLSEGVSAERLRSFGLEYRYGTDYVEGIATLQEFKEALATKTWQYVKRQMTWFKRDTRIHWMNPFAQKEPLLALVENFLHE